MHERIIIDPEIRRGTRVLVARTFGGLAGKTAFDELCREYEEPLKTSKPPSTSHGGDFVVYQAFQLSRFKYA